MVKKCWFCGGTILEGQYFFECKLHIEKFDGERKVYGDSMLYHVHSGCFYTKHNIDALPINNQTITTE